jgi:hypothetical protein
MSYRVKLIQVQTLTKDETMNITEYEITDLLSLGWLSNMEAGEENLYFTLSDGTEGFVKVFR